MKSHYDYLIVGGGLYGLTCGRILTNKGFSCLLIEKKSYLGGLCHTTKKNSIDIHDNGIHIFHTSDNDVWKFVTKYSNFDDCQLKVCATDGKEIYSLPFNMYTFQKILGLNTPEEVYKYLSDQGIDDPKNLEEQAIKFVGKDVYEKLIKGYTEKQWGIKCTELPASIIKRLPVRYSYDNNYFDDSHQGVCNYTELAQHIVDGVNADGKNCEGTVDYLLNTDFLADKEKWLSMANNIIYCGAVDELLDYELGELPWRSLKWEHKTYDYDGHNGQGCALLNNTDLNVPYTRSIDHVQINPKDREYRGETILTYEYPVKWDKTKERCYPIGDSELYDRYVELLNQRYPHIVLGGRIGLYKYMDMDDTIKAALDYCKQQNKFIPTEELQNTANTFAKVWVVGTNNDDVKIPNYYGYYNKFITKSNPSRQNINELNRFLCEFVGMWYVWKNNLYSDYVGFCHYRRMYYIFDSKFELLNNNNIQYWHYMPMAQDLVEHFFPKDAEYPFLERKRNELYVPPKIIDDCVEYLKKQTVIPQDDLKRYCTYNGFGNFPYFPRESFFCKWEMFCKLMSFVNGYVEFVANKYNLKSFEDWKNHVSLEIISYHKKLGKEYVDSHLDGTSFVVFQPKWKFMKIFDEDEGFNVCNNWRVYAYIIEDLISIFIGTHQHVSSVLTEEYILRYNPNA